MTYRNKMQTFNEHSYVGQALLYTGNSSPCPLLSFLVFFLCLEYMCVGVGVCACLCAGAHMHKRAKDREHPSVSFLGCLLPICVLERHGLSIGLELTL